MPFLRSRKTGPETQGASPGPGIESFPHGVPETVFPPVLPRPKTSILGRMFSDCANETCRSGHIRLWRTRKGPIFEHGWACSRECTYSRVRSAILRETLDRGAHADSYSHRIPLGLTLLKQGWVEASDLKKALQQQRDAGGGRIGSWLIRNGVATEETVTRGLGLQWNCPVLCCGTLEPQRLVSFVPRLFVDAFGVLPLRVAAGKLLYLGFEQSLDPALSLAIEKMTGLQVESGVVPTSLFSHWRREMLDVKFPKTELVEAASETAAAVLLSRRIEELRPLGSTLVGLHNLLWLRMSVCADGGQIPEVSQVQDVICSIGRIG